MSAQIIAFPGARALNAPTRPTSVMELPDGAKALVISQRPDGFLVAMHPVVTSADQAVRRTFPSAEEARAHARQLAISYPRLFQVILDHVPRRHTLTELMNDGWLPHDGGSAA